MKKDLRSLTLEELQAEKARLQEQHKSEIGKLRNGYQKEIDKDVIYNTLRETGLLWDEGPDVGGPVGRQVKKLVSKEDNTTKYLFELENNYIIESVFMRYSYGNTMCISTQAGCRMGCAFCASTIGGVEKSLSPSEMLAQIYEAEKDTGDKVNGVVLMGSGEPLDNYDNVIKFIKLINSKDGKNMGQRHITLSTCGLINKMYELADEDLQITLAVSLHAPNDGIRNTIMPVSKANPMDKLLEACKYYTDKTKRRITFEYSLIKGVNDSPQNAKELASKLKGMLCHVNLIPINDVKERDYVRSSNETIKTFEEILLSRGIETTVRRKLGSDIDAACGQLRKRYKDEIKSVKR